MRGIIARRLRSIREVMRRNSGVTTKVIEALFPGYLFAVTEKPRERRMQLKDVPVFTCMLGGGDVSRRHGGRLNTCERGALKEQKALLKN